MWQQFATYVYPSFLRDYLTGKTFVQSRNICEIYYYAYFFVTVD